MVRFFAFIAVCFFISCSPIQTVEGLGGGISSKAFSRFSAVVPTQSKGFEKSSRSSQNTSIAHSKNQSGGGFSGCGDFHLSDHPLVEKWLNYFSNSPKGRKFMRGTLERSNRYVPMMQQILSESGGVPTTLAYVPFIESGFRSNALSHKGAKGYWQFMRKTANDFGLAINRYVDERQDPELSTRAAARYFKVLCQTLRTGTDESWPLILAGYNAGAKRISDITVFSANRNFWQLADKNRLPKETKEYVPQIIAAVKIAQAPYDYGFDNLNFYPPMEFEVIKVPKRSYFSKIAKRYGWDYKELRALNPMFKTDFIPGHGNSALIRVPLS